MSNICVPPLFYTMPAEIINSDDVTSGPCRLVFIAVAPGKLGNARTLIFPCLQVHSCIFKSEKNRRRPWFKQKAIREKPFFILVTNRHYGLSSSDTDTILNTFHEYPWVQQPLRCSFLYTVMYHIGLVSRAVKMVYKRKLTITIGQNFKSPIYND